MSKPNFEELKLEIIKLHKAEINAHLNKEISFFTKNLSDQYMTISRGNIDYPTNEEVNTTFTKYLSNTSFEKYEDMTEPIINFSDDGSVAWCVFQVKVKGNRIKDDKEVKLEFICAWMTIYRRQKNTWIRLSDVSTFK